MSAVKRIKCGHVNRYIVFDGASGILVDTGKKEYLYTIVKARVSHIRLN